MARLKNGNVNSEEKQNPKNKKDLITQILKKKTKEKFLSEKSY